MSILRAAARGRAGAATGLERMTVDDYLAELQSWGQSFGYGGLDYRGRVEQTLLGEVETAGADFAGLAQHAHAANGVVFACMLVRQLAFSSVRFRWQRLTDGRPAAMFGTSDLGILERPWTGGTTQDLLSRLIQDADLAGNAYVTRYQGEIIRLRPDWVDVAVRRRMVPTLTTDDEETRAQLGWIKAGYIYWEGGRRGREGEPVTFFADQVAHFAPLPDPQAAYRGMSWLTPIAREVAADKTITRHKERFFQNGATPNMVVRHAAGAEIASIKRFAAELDERHAGTDNAGRTLHLYPGADVTVVGKDFQQVDLKNVQGAGETRIAAAAGVPPVIVGLSEGLEAATYSNYGQARRRLADGTIHPLWQNAAGSLEPIVEAPPRVPGQDPSSVRLWYDASNVPFLREDEKDAATIAETQARTIRTLVDGGYTPESAVAAVTSGDWRLLDHTGLYSVQLQAPGGATPTTPTEQETPDG